MIVYPTLMRPFSRSITLTLETSLQPSAGYSADT